MGCKLLLIDLSITLDLIAKSGKVELWLDFWNFQSL